MLNITVQTNQVIHLNNEALLTKHYLKVMYIDKQNDEVRLRQSSNDVDYDFTMSAGEEKMLDEDTKLHFNSINHYTSAARDIDYVALGFDAPRHVRIKGEWNIKGNK